MDKNPIPPIDLSVLPTNSGIYMFRDGRGHILYIGKAKNLRNRVKSYWSRHTWQERPKLAVLVPQISDIETIITNTERESLILEANLIYRHQPKYNVLLKDNKSFPWLAITYGESYPRLVVVRNIQTFRKKYPKAKFFGPYTDSGHMYKLLDVVNQLFPLRKRANPLYNDRPCLNYHIGKCLAPCQKMVTEAEYHEMLRGIELFFGGRHDALMADMQTKMQYSSAQMDYERAAKYRDQISLIQRSIESQIVVLDDIKCQRDIIAIYTEADMLSVQIYKVRQGKLIAREAYLSDINEYLSLGETILSMISQIYSVRDDIPTEILCSPLVAELDISTLSLDLIAILSDIASKNIRIVFPKKGIKHEQLALAMENAKTHLTQYLQKKSKASYALTLLQEALGIGHIPYQIDCFDISHLQGTEVVASCVRLSHAMPNKSMYRKLKMSIDQNDDYASMHEALQKRYKNHADEIPDLIVIDGGIGQLRSAYESMCKIGHAGVHMVSLAKRAEEIYKLNPHDPKLSPTKIVLPYSSPALHVVQRVRDEAHRFALTFGRQRRAKATLKSIIDDIPLPQTQKSKIKQHFGADDLQNATALDIQDRLSISAKAAEKIYLTVHEYFKNQS